MKFMILALIVLTAGCTSLRQPTTQEVEIKTSPIDRPNLILPNIDRVTTREVEWQILTPENIDDVFASLESQGKAVVLFAVTEEGYEDIALNIRDILRIILQQQSVIDGYKSYYLTTDGNIVEYNNALLE